MTAEPGSTGARNAAFLLVIAYLGFISLGLPDTLLGVAWPRVRDSFGVPQDAAAFIFFGTGLSYFFSSFFTGPMLRRFGVGLLLAGSSAIVALSNFGYAAAPWWFLFVGCSLLHGVGSGAIDAGLNHYVARHFSARHMNWLHACYSLGATLGPFIMTAVLAAHAHWRIGYLSVAIVLATLTALFAATRRSWSDNGAASSADPSETRPAPVTMRETLSHRRVWLQCLIFFIYTGLEITVGQWSFTVLTESRHVPATTAGVWVTIYWGSIAAGRVLFGFIVERLGIDRLLRRVLFFVAGGAFAFLYTGATVASPIALACIGLGLAPIYPCLMTRTPERLGHGLAAHAIGLQVSFAMLGGAALPSLAGFLSARLGLEVIPMTALAMAGAIFLLHEVLMAITSPSRKE